MENYPVVKKIVMKFRKIISLVLCVSLLLNSAGVSFAMYDPETQRFTARDPVMGNFQEPLTLHAYLYCRNDPVNNRDPRGRMAETVAVTGIMAYQYAVVAAAAIGLGGIIAYQLQQSVAWHNTRLLLATAASETLNDIDACVKSLLRRRC